MSAAVLLAASALIIFPNPAGATGNPWIRVAVPSPSATRNVLASVSCVSSTACTAVGHYEDTAGIHPLVIRTADGTTWTRTSAPAPSNLAELRDVSCTTANQCTAVGEYLSGFDGDEARFATFVIRTTNGVAWTVVPSPTPGGSSILNSVSCITATRCRAVGIAGASSLVLRTSDGATWFREPSPNRGRGDNELLSIDCVNNSSCTAVGAYQPAPGQRVHARTFVVHTVNGPPWVVVPSPNPSPSLTESYLNEVSCVATTCVAVGLNWPLLTGSPRSFILRTTDGISWTRSLTPVPSVGAQVELLGVDCQTTTACTATGTIWNSNRDEIIQNVILRTTNGTSWSTLSPVSERPHRALLSVSCATEITCFSVGTFNDTGEFVDPLRPLVMRES